MLALAVTTDGKISAFRNCGEAPDGSIPVQPDDWQIVARRVVAFCDE